MDNDASKINLEIINVKGWHGDYVELTIPPSPNIPDLESRIYNGLCFEGTNLSEGRGKKLHSKFLVHLGLIHKRYGYCQLPKFKGVLF